MGLLIKNMRGNSWKTSEIDKLKNLNKTGKNLREISKILNRPYSSVKTKMRFLTMKANPHKVLSKEKIETLISDYKSEMKYTDILKKHKISDKYLKKILTNNKIESRLKIKQNLLNKKFGKLTVISLIENSYTYHRRKWLCKCECGKEVSRISSFLTSHSKKYLISCGCAKKDIKGKNSQLWTGYEGLSGSFFSAIKHGAKIRNLDFNVTIEYLWNLFANQDKKCVISGIKLQLLEHGQLDNTASLDRIDSSKGYIEGNVQWVHKDINWMKQDFSDEYFIKICKIVHNNNL